MTKAAELIDRAPRLRAEARRLYEEAGVGEGVEGCGEHLGPNLGEAAT